jgi:uncharacterized protein (TIGR02996 family)
MPVWFVYRCYDVGPTARHFRRFDDDTVLEWFQRNWEDLAVDEQELADERLEVVLGCGGWPLFMPFLRSAEEGLPVPDSIEEVRSRLWEPFGPETVPPGSSHEIQWLATDDGEGGAFYFFDGHFLAESGPLAAYLLHEDWRLPSGSGEGGLTPTEKTEEAGPAGDGPGATYAIFLERESRYPLDDLTPAWRIEGVRLPGLVRHLFASPPEDGWPCAGLEDLPVLAFAGVSMSDPMENAFLSAIRANPSDAVAWAAWNDWREERGAEPPGISLLRDAFVRMARLPGKLQDEFSRKSSPEALLEIETKHRAQLRTSLKSLIHVEPHLAQMCLDGSQDDERGPYFGQWILFDDLWAGAHPELADALLTWCARWEVLSEG